MITFLSSKARFLPEIPEGVTQSHTAMQTGQSYCPIVASLKGREVTANLACPVVSHLCLFSVSSAERRAAKPPHRRPLKLQAPQTMKKGPRPPALRKRALP